MMSIKSDRWIRQMAQTRGLIEPFEPSQVRTVGDRRVISYGTSSYGYDVRCARRVQDLHQHQLGDRGPEGVRRKQLRRHHRRRVHHPAQLVRAGAHGEYFRIRATC
jgi:deoxycytidine triphosphate deaminase